MTWGCLSAVWWQPIFPVRQTFDAVLAVTLRAKGVTRIHTRNTRDVSAAGFALLIAPLRGANPLD